MAEDGDDWFSDKNYILQPNTEILKVDNPTKRSVISMLNKIGHPFSGQFASRGQFVFRHQVFVDNCIDAMCVVQQKEAYRYAMVQASCNNFVIRGPSSKYSDCSFVLY